MKGRGAEQGGKLKAERQVLTETRLMVGWTRVPGGVGTAERGCPSQTRSHKPTPGLGLCEEDTASLPRLSSLCVSVFLSIALPCSFPRLCCKSHIPGMMSQKNRWAKDQVFREGPDEGVTFTASGSWAMGRK